MFRFAVATGCAQLVEGARVTVERHSAEAEVETYCPSVSGFTARQGKCIGDFISNFANGEYANYGQDSNGGIRSAGDAGRKCAQHYDCVGFYTREGVGYSHYRSNINYVDYSGFSSGYCCYERSGYSLAEESAEIADASESLVTQEEDSQPQHCNQRTCSGMSRCSPISYGAYGCGYRCHRGREVHLFNNHCQGGNRVSLLEEDTKEEASDSLATEEELSGSCTRQSSTDYAGGDIDVNPCYSENQCCTRCNRNSRCHVAVWQPSVNMCYLKDRGHGSRSWNSGTTALWR